MGEGRYEETIRPDFVGAQGEPGRLVQTKSDRASYDYGNMKKFATIGNFVFRFPQ